MDRYLSAGKVKDIFDISRQTLFNWENKELISPGKTPGGQRRYSEKQIRQLLGLEPEPPAESHRLREVAEKAADLLSERYSQLIKEIILYGSVARGTAGDESDIDLVVITTADEKTVSQRRREFHRLLAELKVEHGVSISIQVFTDKKWKEMKKTAYRREVEGKELNSKM